MRERKISAEYVPDSSDGIKTEMKESLNEENSENEIAN